jgi:broad specificity phosphatase PhoE
MDLYHSRKETFMIYLIRHGQTAWSESGQHTGLTDIPLTENGKSEAAKLKKRLNSLSFKKVICSPLMRAKETCQICGFLSQAEINNDALEWNYGKYEGLTTSQIHAHDPDWNVFTKGCPGGESLSDVEKRALHLIATVKKVQGDVAIFSSGHFLRAFATLWIGLPIQRGTSFFLSTASLSILGYERETPVFITWNDTTHLLQ